MTISGPDRRSAPEPAPRGPLACATIAGVSNRRPQGLEHLTDEEYEELERVVKENFARVKAEFAAERLEKQRLGFETDEDLDSKAFQLISDRVEGESDKILALAEPLRSYYLTRLFEWWSLSDGSGAIPSEAPELLDEIGPAYQALGLADAADAFDRYLESAVVQRLLAHDDAELSDTELDEINALFDAIGTHDEERIQLIRANRKAFGV